MFFRFILGWLFCCFDVVLAVQKSTIEVCFFDTGQGNLIAIRANDVNPRTKKTSSKLIFIDCGSTLHKEQEYGKFLKNKKDARNQKLVELFKGISDYGILITHNHKDHNNLIETIEDIGPKNRRKESVAWIIRPMSRKMFTLYPKDSRNRNVPTIADVLEEDWENFCNEDLLRIENSLGRIVRVVPIRPKRWQNNGAQNPEHDFNMMYLVEFAGRRILFTGDVSPQLLAQDMNDPSCAREMKSADFLVLPHHGSNRSGELMIKAAINPEMCIICSDPSGRDHLPWSEVSDFSLKNDGNIKVKKHIMSTAGGVEEKSIPVFVTCDAAQGYYELVIEANGMATLFDGPTAKQQNLFCFQSL